MNKKFINLESKVSIYIMILIVSILSLTSCAQMDANNSKSVVEPDFESIDEYYLDEEKDALDEAQNISDTTSKVSEFGETIDDEKTIFKDEDGNVRIVNSNGIIIASSVDGDFDYIYAYGDGYYALYHRETGFDLEEKYLYIIDSDGNEIMRTDESEYDFLSDLDYERNQIDFGNNCYKGNGWIYLNKSVERKQYNTAIVKSDYYNCRTNEMKTIESFHSNYGTPDTGKNGKHDDYDFKGLFETDLIFSPESPYDFIRTAEYEVTIFDNSLNSVESFDFTDDPESSFGIYSDGGFIYYKDHQLNFYDCDLKTSKPICSDSDKIDYKKSYLFKFENGKSYIILKGTDGKNYQASIDKQGNYVEEPHL